ncbi:restriction endonuclease [Chryseobacterium sp. WX]|uniref:restriction endonuclease n=1 Tax=Chryseobacterium sp. WX TaxID=3031803 RepID=UPI00240A8BFB|nr:restriction endonuclease [Chryseobacterium sp. WX]WFB70044.1 restriction endonuclease [Chryseobacterium sp. WX]
MIERQPEKNEKDALEILSKQLSQIGFNVKFSDNVQRLRGPDFIANKRINGIEYKIAIELKSNKQITEAIRNGINTLKEVNKKNHFDKLLLLLLNKNSKNFNNANLIKYQNENPTNLEIINLDDLEKWSQNLSDEISPKEQNEVFFYIRQISKKFIELVGKDIENLKDLEWRDLERMVSELFEGIGFKTTLTPSSKDGGKDIILECLINDIQKTFIIEIKHWRSATKVGQAAVKEFTQVIINEKRDKGLFLSTYGFTNNYYESLSEKQKSIVHFGEKEKIVELCKIYEKINNGIWNPIYTLEDILFENTTGI